VDVEAPPGSPAPGTPFVAGNGSTDRDSDSPSESSIGSRTESVRVDRQGEGGLEPRREGEPRAGAETRTTAEAATGGGGGALGGAGERAPAVQPEAARPVRVTRPPRQAVESDARPLCMKTYCWFLKLRKGACSCTRDTPVDGPYNSAEVLETGALLNVPSWSGGPRVNKRIVSVEDDGSSEFTVVTSDGISHSSR
jgi:hypothetical protein